MIETTGEGKSAVATPDGKKPKEEEVAVVVPILVFRDLLFLLRNTATLYERMRLKKVVQRTRPPRRRERKMEG